MRILIVTQKVDMDDPVLGFFHRWIIEFAKHFERVSVICLEMGAHELPENTKVFSLGKELGKSNIRALYRFYKYVWTLRRDYDVVFVHMNPEYAVLAGDYWKLMGKKIALWYTHREKNLKLKIATLMSDVIFTASKESFTLPSRKVKVMGHGIDVGAFSCPAYGGQKEEVRLLQVGRITPIKHCVEAVEALKLLGDGYKLKFIGAPVTKSDEKYFEKLKEVAGPNVEFAGSLPPNELPAEYCAADATLNLTPTGGLDKAVLESMAAGRITLTSNKSFESYLAPYTDKLVLGDCEPETIASAVRSVFDSGDVRAMTAKLKESALQRASVESLINNISREIHGLV